MLRERRQRPACQITDPETDDELWIPISAAKGWVPGPFIARLKRKGKITFVDLGP